MFNIKYFHFKIKERKEFYILVLIVLLATFLRLFKLGSQSLWIDEINAVILANKSIFKILFYGDTAAPFIYLVNHFWQKLGNSDFMVRFPSVIFGVLSIHAAYKLAKMFFGIKEALFSSFLMSISLYHVMYSQEAARPYTAFMLFSLLSFYCLYQILNCDAKKYLIGFIIFNVLNLYTHYFSIFVLAFEIFIGLTLSFSGISEGKQNFRNITSKILKLIKALIWIFAISLPISIGFFAASRSELAGGRVVLNPIYYKNLLCRYGAGNGLTFFIYNLFFLSGLTSLFKGNKRKEIFLLIFCLIFPFLVLSFMELKHFFHIRYVIFTYPLYIIIVSKGITNILDMKLLKPLKQKALLLIVIIFLGLSFTPLRLYYQMPARLADWRGAADYIYSKAKDGAVVITQECQDALVKYYLAKKPSTKQITFITHHNDPLYFSEMLSRNTGREIYYVGYGGNDIGLGSEQFCSVAEKYFGERKELFSWVYPELLKRELIDGDRNSWVDVGAWGYRLVIYSNPSIKK